MTSGFHLTRPNCHFFISYCYQIQLSIDIFLGHLSSLSFVTLHVSGFLRTLSLHFFSCLLANASPHLISKDERNHSLVFRLLSFSWQYFLDWGYKYSILYLHQKTFSWELKCLTAILGCLIGIIYTQSISSVEPLILLSKTASSSVSSCHKKYNHYSSQILKNHVFHFPFLIHWQVL